MKINLKLDYCSTCGGDCCFTDCRKEYIQESVCLHPYNGVKETCNRYPIMKLKEYVLDEGCLGVLRDEIPIQTLESIIKRLNKGETNFKVNVKGLKFLCSEEK